MSDDFDYSAAFEYNPQGQRGLRREYTEEDRNPGVMDYLRGLKAGVEQSVQGAAAATQYLTQSDLGDETRREWGAAADNTLANTSHEFQRRQQLAFFPDDGEASIWNEGVTGFLKAVGAKATTAAPSMVAAIIPAGVVGVTARALGASLATRIAVSGATGKAAASVQNLGDVANQIYSDVDKMSHQELMSRSPRYADYVNGGMSEREARTKFMNEVAGVAPLAAGAITYMTGGIEGQIGERLGGKASEGIIKGFKKGAVGEGVQEGIESGTGEALSQYELKREYLTGDYDLRKIMNATIEGSLVGAALGGGTGAIGGIGAKSESGIDTVDAKQPDAAQAVALAANQSSAPAPAQAAQAPTVAEPPPPSGTDLVQVAVDRLTRKGVEITPEMRADIEQRIGGITETGQERGTRFQQVLNDLYGAHAPTQQTQAPNFDEIYQQALDLVRSQNNASFSFVQRTLKLKGDVAAKIMTRLEQEGVVTPANKSGRRKVVQKEQPAPAGPAAVANDAGKNVPETGATLKKQRGLLLARQKAAVLYTDPATVIPLPAGNSGLAQIEIPQGVIQFNPKFVSEEEVRAAAESNTLNEILGLGPISKKQATERVEAGEKPAAVALVDKDGTEIVSALGTDQTAPVQAEALGQMASPTDTVVKTTPDAIIEARLNEIGGEIQGSKEEVKKANSPSAQTTAPASAPSKAATLTPAGEELLASVANGGVPGFMTNNLKRVAAENGVIVETNDTPNSVIEKLKAKAQAPTAAPAPQVATAPAAPKKGGAITPKGKKKQAAKEKVDRLTESGEKLLKQAASGVRFLVLSPSMKRVATENKISFEPTDDPNSIIEKLRAKKEATKEEEVAPQEEPVTQFIPTAEEIAAYKAANTSTTPDGRKVLPDMSESAIQAWVGQQAQLDENFRNVEEQNARREQAQKDLQESVSLEETDDERDLSKWNLTNEAATDSRDGQAAKDELTRQAQAAKEIIEANWSQTPGAEAKRVLFTRLGKILELAQKAGIQIPQKWANRRPVFLGYLRNIADMHRMLDNDLNRGKEIPFSLVNQFLTDEYFARENKFEEIIKRRLEQGDAVMKKSTNTNESVNKDEADPNELAGDLSSFGADEAETNLIGRQKEVVEEGEERADDADLEDREVKLKGRERPPVKIDEDAGRGFSGPTKPVVVASTKRRGAPSAQELREKLKTRMTPAQQEAIPDAIINKMLDFNLSPEEEDKLLDDLVAQVESGKPVSISSLPSVTVSGEFGKAKALDTRSASEFLENVSFDNSSGVGGLMKPLLNMIRKKLLTAVGNVQIHIVDDAEFDRITLGPSSSNGRLRGYSHYEPNTGVNYVVIPARLINSKNLIHTVMHELVHAATVEALTDPAAAKIVENIKSIMEQVEKAGITFNPKTGENYGLTTVAEFVAEAMSNPDFQEALSRVKVSEEFAKSVGLPAWRAQSLYSAVVNSIRELLNTLVGLNLPYRSSTALEAIIQQSEQLMLGKLPEDSAFYSKTMDLWGTRSNERQAALESRTEDKLAYIPKMVKDLPLTIQEAASDILRTMLGENVPFWSDLKEASAFTFGTKGILSGRENFHPGEFVTDIYNEVAREYFYARKNGLANDEADRKAILDELDKRVPATNDFMREYDAKNIRKDIEKLDPRILPYIESLLKKFEDREISLRRLAAEAQMISEELSTSMFSSDEDRALADAAHSASYAIARRLPISLSHARSATMQNNFGNPFLPAYETGKAMVADVVHGTSYLFDKFSRDFLGKTTGAPSAREGFFFARTPDTAQRYVDMSEGDIMSRGEKPSQRMVTARIKMDNPLVFDFEGQQGRVFRYSELIKQAKEEGRDGVVMLNTHDGGPTDTIYVVFDESQISDRFKPREEGMYFPMRDFGVQETAANAASGFGAWVKKVGISGMSLTQLSQQFEGTFVKGGRDLLDDLTSVTRKMDPYADAKREQAEQLAQRFIEFQRLNRDEANQFTDLGLRATMAGVNLGANADNSHLGQNAFDGVQAKKLLPELQADFARLTQQGKALWQEMTQFYRDQQNEMTRGLIDNILDTLPEATQTAIGAGRAGLVSRVMAGTLTDADKKLINSATVSKALADAAELRSVKGTYFPLMRFGNQVVETLDKWGNLMGGKAISDDQVEFKGATEKEARAKAEAFVKDSDLQYLSRKVEYYDPATGKQINATDAKNLTAMEVRYVVRMQRRGVHFFESATKANEFRKQALADGYEKVGEVQTKRDTALGSAELTTAQLTSLLSSIEGRKDLSSGMRDQMRTAMYQASARLMAGNRVQKRSIARQKVEGASNDFARVLLQYGEATSRYLAKIKFMPQIRQIMSDMREVTQQGKYEKGQADRVELLNHLNDRIERNVISTSTPGAVVQTWLQLSYLDKLGSLAYSITNSMQTIMVSYPVLAGRFGATKTGLALTNAYRAIGYGDAVIGGLMNTVKSTKQFAQTALLNTDDILGGIMKSAAKEKDGKNLTSMLNVLIEQGLISKESGFELAGSVSQGAGPVRTNLNKVDRIMRQLPTAIEAINRTTTAIAAYRMAVEGGMSHEKATDFALKTVDNTQGDYRSSLGATAFNNPLLRPALQFKRYAQLMTYLMADMTNRAFRGASKEERSVARKQLMQLAGVQIAMAGALSLPGLEIAKVAFMVAAALGFGDGWDDQEEKLRKLANDTLGKTWGELLTKGVVSRALGIDLSSRVSLADLWTFGEPKSSDRNDLLSYGAAWALGAPGSLALDWLQGVQEAGKGNYLKAAELLLPIKTLGDMAKVARKYDDTTAVEAGLNVVGLRSARQANEGEAFGDKKRAGERKEKEFKELRQQFFDAKTAGDRAKAISKNREWNRDAPLKLKLPVRYNEERRAG